MCSKTSLFKVCSSETYLTIHVVTCSPLPRYDGYVREVASPLWGRSCSYSKIASIWFIDITQFYWSKINCSKFTPGTLKYFYIANNWKYAYMKHLNIFHEQNTFLFLHISLPHIEWDNIYLCILSSIHNFFALRNVHDFQAT